MNNDTHTEAEEIDKAISGEYVLREYVLRGAVLRLQIQTTVLGNAEKQPKGTFICKKM